MEKLDKWDVIAALIGLMAWFRGEKSPAASTSGSGEMDGKQKIVSILHAFVSTVDESMWQSLITPLNPKQKLALTKLLKFLNRFRERDSFRLTVVNAPGATTIVENPDPSDKTGKKKIKKVVKVGEYSDQDTRVVFLRDIADLVDDPTWGVKGVRRMLRTHELATENKVAKNALKVWKGFLSWMNQAVCEFFRVDNLGDITPDQVAHVVAGNVHVLARQVPYRRPSDVNIGFWRGNYRRYPIRTIGMAISIIAVLGWSILIANS